MIDVKKLLSDFQRTYRRQEAIELLSPRWKKLNAEQGAPSSTGFCYIAAEALFHILIDLDPRSMCASYEEAGERCTHWWLVVDGKIIDPTASQYTKLDLKPPYDKGRGKDFLTKSPSKRAQQLIKLVKKT